MEGRLDCIWGIDQQVSIVSLLVKGVATGPYLISKAYNF